MRLLGRELACTIGECSNGLEALRALSERHVDLLLLDVDMPSLDGGDTLAAIRASRELRTLPVLILSNERRIDTVMKLVGFGVDGYLFKPLRVKPLRETLERLQPTLAARRRDSTRRPAPCATRADQPALPPAALLVDGDQGFRAAFARESRLPGPIVIAGSGTEALARFRQTPVPLAFIGSAIGMLTPARLVQRLRLLAGDGRLSIVGVCDGSEPDASCGFDAVIERTVDPDRLALAISRVTARPEAAGPAPKEPAAAAPPPFDVMAFGTRVAAALAEAGTQAFKLLVNAEIQQGRAPEEPGPVIGAYVDLQLQNGCLVTLGVETSLVSSRAITARMLGTETGDVTPDDARSAVQEIVKLLGAHTLQQLEGGIDANDCSEPRSERDVAGTERRRGRQQSLSYTIPAVGASVTVRLDIFSPVLTASAAA
jgi:CheY-like chemotaxis protein